jgi:hypothetical protein
MTHILGEHACVRFGNLRLWAARGLVHIEDSRDGSFETISVRSTLERMVALQQMLGNSRTELHKAGTMERRVFDDIQTMLESMVDVCRKAQKQGMPDDPRARNWIKDARPTTVVVPDGRDVF